MNTGSAVVTSVIRWSWCLCLVTVSSMQLLGTVVANDETAESARAKLLETFLDEFVPITPGNGEFPPSFTMGSAQGLKSEQPAHEVTLKRPFAMAKYEVPQALYQSVMGKNPSRWKGKRNSAETMTFQDALTFCEKVTQELRTRGMIGDDEFVRLPSEAEWEYCCRAGTNTAYSFGDLAQGANDSRSGSKATILNEYGWHTGNAAGNDPAVGVLKPNPWGLYDMHGYLWEYTRDDWSADYSHAPPDGSPYQAKPAQGTATSATLRGGSWKDRFTELRCAARKKFPRDQGDDAVGFRCVKARY